MEFPNDADGAVLKGLHERGCDLTKPMDVDFHVAAPTKKCANDISKEVAKHGFKVEVVCEDSGGFTCWCTKTMILTYESVIAAQELMDQIAKPLGGYSDGWGTMGNADSE